MQLALFFIQFFSQKSRTQTTQNENYRFAQNCRTRQKELDFVLPKTAAQDKRNSISFCTKLSHKTKGTRFRFAQNCLTRQKKLDFVLPKTAAQSKVKTFFIVFCFFSARNSGKNRNKQSNMKLFYYLCNLLFVRLCFQNCTAVFVRGIFACVTNGAYLPSFFSNLSSAVILALLTSTVFTT